MSSETPERRLKGQPVSPGIAAGTMVMDARGLNSPVTRRILPTELEQEWARFESAIARTEEELRLLKERVERLSGAT